VLGAALNEPWLTVGWTWSQADEGEESEEEDGKGKKKCRASLFRTLLDAVGCCTYWHPMSYQYS